MKIRPQSNTHRRAQARRGRRFGLTAHRKRGTFRYCQYLKVQSRAVEIDDTTDDIPTTSPNPINTKGE